MKHMAGRKRNSAKEIVRKLRSADELAAEGKTARRSPQLQVSPATLSNWRRSYGGMDTEAAKERKELREQKLSEPSCQAPRRGHAQRHVEQVGAVGVQGRWAGPLHLPPASPRAEP